MVIVYFDTSLLEYESEPGIPPYFLRLVGPIQLYLHWSQKTLVHIADAYPCHINRFGRVKNLMKPPGVSPITHHRIIQIGVSFRQKNKRTYFSLVLLFF